MLKKSLSILLVLVIMSVSILGISLVTAAATTKEDDQTNSQPIITEETIATKGDTMEPPETSQSPTTTYSVTKGELESEVELLGRSYPVGSIFRNEMDFWNAIDYAQEILAKENPTQEELNTAYYNLISAFENLELIGWNAAPYILGDCDLDDDVNVKDATKIQLALSKLDTIPYYSRADVNNDFSVNVKDATMIQLYCANFTDEVSCGYTGTQSIQYYNNEIYDI